VDALQLHSNTQSQWFRAQGGAPTLTMEPGSSVSNVSLNYCTSYPRPCFSPCRVALGCGTGLPVQEGGQSADSCFVTYALGAFAFLRSSFYPAFALFFSFALASTKAQKKCQHQPLLCTMSTVSYFNFILLYTTSILSYFHFYCPLVYLLFQHSVSRFQNAINYICTI
jgi:hypothetical protein